MRCCKYVERVMLPAARTQAVTDEPNCNCAFPLFIAVARNAFPGQTSVQLFARARAPSHWSSNACVCVRVCGVYLRHTSAHHPNCGTLALRRPVRKTRNLFVALVWPHCLRFVAPHRMYFDYLVLRRYAKKVHLNGNPMTSWRAAFKDARTMYSRTHDARILQMQLRRSMLLVAHRQCIEPKSIRYACWGVWTQKVHLSCFHFGHSAVRIYAAPLSLQQWWL